MKLQKKIMIRYMIFAIVIILMIGGIYLFLNISSYTEKMNQEFITMSDVTMKQLENTMQTMESVTSYLLSNQSVLEALTSLATYSGGMNDADFYFDEDVTAIRSAINTYYMLNEFYKIIIFNKQGIVISNHTDQVRMKDFSYEKYGRKEEIEGTKGRNVIIGLHMDDWAVSKPAEVVSLIREIQGMERGYIEVQQMQSSIAKQIKLQSANVDFIVLRKDGQLIYTTNTELNLDEYMQYLTGTQKKIQSIITGRDKPVTFMEQYSLEQDMILLTVNHTDVLAESLKMVLPVTISLLIGALLLSFGYIYVTSIQVTKPIRQLQKFMEHTDLDNMEQEINEKISNDEIEALYNSYQEVLKRLNEAVRKEKRLSLLQLQAQFDLLQAQVNPHFIYNVLNVISHRGIISDDEIICEICSDLSQLLRYSTNTKEKYAFVKDEMNYLQQYLSLLKYRYDHRLQYEISIDETIFQELLPKIVLQQIVENSIIHGYAESSEIIEIAIEGKWHEWGFHIKVSDKGSGISKRKQEELYAQMNRVKHKLTKDRSNVEMEIGGMGLVNTYARLYLLYQDNMDICFENNLNKGAQVTIKIIKGGADVSSIDRR